jgi:hypothetical protein
VDPVYTDLNSDPEHWFKEDKFSSYHQPDTIPATSKVQYIGNFWYESNSQTARVQNILELKAPKITYNSNSMRSPTVGANCDQYKDEDAPRLGKGKGGPTLASERVPAATGEDAPRLGRGKAGQTLASERVPAATGKDAPRLERGKGGQTLPSERVPAATSTQVRTPEGWEEEMDQPCQISG